MSLCCFGDPGSACYWDEKSRGCTNISDYRREPSLHFHLDFEPSFFGPWARPTPLPRGWEPQSSLMGCHSAMRKHAANLPASTVFLKCTQAPSCIVSAARRGLWGGVQRRHAESPAPTSPLLQSPVRSPGSRTPNARRRAARKDGAVCVNTHQEPNTLILFWRHRSVVFPTAPFTLSVAVRVTENSTRG